MSPAFPQNKNLISQSLHSTAMNVNFNELRFCNNSKYNAFIQVLSLFIRTTHMPTVVAILGQRSTCELGCRTYFYRDRDRGPVVSLAPCVCADPGQDTSYSRQCCGRCKVKGQCLCGPRRRETNTGSPPKGIQASALCRALF